MGLMTSMRTREDVFQCSVLEVVVANAPLSSTTEQGGCRSGLIREEQPGLRVCRGCLHLPLLLLLKVVQIPAVRYCSLNCIPCPLV